MTTAKFLSPSYTAFMLRDPVYPDRYWNGVCIVPSVHRWPNGIKGTGIKFGTTGKRWSSREAAMKAYAEYEITVSLIYMKKASSNMDWHKLPSSLELIEVEVVQTVVSTKALPVFKHAEFIASHRVASNENRPHMDAALRALKDEKADTFRYMVRVPEAMPRNFASNIKQQVAALGIEAPLICFPFFFITNDADLMGFKLALPHVMAWEFKTGKKVLG